MKREALKIADRISVLVEGKEIPVNNPDKLLWPAAGVTKLQYITYLTAVAPFIVPYTKGRMAMLWRYGNGIGGEKTEERSVYGHPPDWVPTIVYQGKRRIMLDDEATLIWYAATREALEIHVPFDRYERKDYPTELVFDLDPAGAGDFAFVRTVALEVKRTLDSLGLLSFAKTSGATGMQIYVPIEDKYTYEETRKINTFIAEYLVQKMPGRLTLDRVVERRGAKLYFDYLQLWRGRTMVVPYTVRARPAATVSAPVAWEEVERGFVPEHFTIRNMIGRVRTIGDMFSTVTERDPKYLQNLDGILSFINAHR